MREDLIAKKSVGGRAPSLQLQDGRFHCWRDLRARKSVGGKAPRLQLREGHAGWPGRGWRKESRVRKTGASKGRVDCYWHTPVQHCRFRSKVEVDKFLMALTTAGDGDEKNAKLAMNKNHR